MTDPTESLASDVSLQDRYAPLSRCFGCGPANDKGLRIKSHVHALASPEAVAAPTATTTHGGSASPAPAPGAVPLGGGEGEEVVATWTCEPHHEAFPGMLNGGIAGALLDCHSNWTAAYTLMKARGLDAPPCTVTSEFAVKLRRPTPTDQGMTLRAKAVSTEGDMVTVEATLEAGGKITATCRGVFVAVKEGHPAYHRW